MSGIKRAKANIKSYLRLHLKIWHKTERRLVKRHFIDLSKLIHHHTAKRPHNYLVNKNRHYRYWHEHPRHHRVHFGILGIYLVGIFIYSYFSITSVFALNSWDQTDWSGGAASGAVTGTVDTYESASDITTTPAGELSLDGDANYAVMRGNRLSSGSTNLNVSSLTSLRFNAGQSYNSSYFSYDGGSPTKLTVEQDGDYFLSYTLATNSDEVEDSGNRSGIGSYVYVNDSQADVGGGRSGYIRNYVGHFESSNHLGVMLEDLAAGDEIEMRVGNITSDTSHPITGDATLYAEYVPGSETIFNATSTRTTSGADLNSTEVALEWDQTTADSGFTHTDGNPDITLDSTGQYLVAVNVPLGGSVQRANVEGNVLLDGSMIDGGEFKQGYIRNGNGHVDSSIHWFGIVEASSADQILSISLQQEGAAGSITVDGEKATLFVKKLPNTDGLYVAEATQAAGSSEWNPGTKSKINWATDNIIDTDIFSHNTSSDNDEITVQEDGDYLLSFDAGFTSSGQRVNPKITVQVNDTNVTGAEAKSAYIRASSGHNDASDNMLVPLTGLSAGDVITISVEQESDTTNTTSLTSNAAQLMIQRIGYPSSGTLVSNVFNATYPADWSAVNYNKSGSGTTTVKVRSDNNSDMSSATDWSSCNSLSSGTVLSSSSCVSNEDQYLQYRVTLQPNGSNTPVFEDIAINYAASDQIVPDTNASSLEMYKSDGGAGVDGNGWTNAEQPYFSWTAGADDPTNSSGVKGYCLYLGQDSGGDPVTTKGVLGTSPVSTNEACQFAVNSTDVDLSTSGYMGSGMTSSDSPYYLNIKIIDNANNVFSGSPAQFQFRFDNTKPSNPAFITAPSQFIATKEVDLTWETSGGSAANDANSGLAGLQYKIGNDGTWYGDSHSGDEDDSDLLANDGSYTTQDPTDYDALEEGNNIIYFRTWDNAGNISQAYVTTVIKLNTSSPSPPQNVSADPYTNTANSFEFSWLPPSSYTGSENNLTYCYTFNTLPTQATCSFTGDGETSLEADAYATQPGENTLYLVAKDEAGNINYATYASTTFVANTPAPGISKNVEIADISVKQTASWKIALSWDQPNNVGAGVSNYKIYRSTNGSDYSVAATTSATSFVDQNLQKRTYYYRIKACDSANNCGAQTAGVSMLPTGRFTEPATLVTQPDETGITTRKATAQWITERTSDSKIAIGTKSGHYGSEEVSNSDQVTQHSLSLTGLDPGTTYYYVAKWTDEDGNTGTSSEKTFTTLPAPTVKNVELRRATLSTAIIDFTSTNAVGINIYFGKSENFGGLKEVNTSTSESSYTIELEGLDDGSTYFYKLNPIDSDGNEYEGTVLNFKTPPRPRISNVRIEHIKDSASGAHKVTWETNVKTSSLVRYSSPKHAAQEISDSTLVTDHSVVLNRLEDNTTYRLTVESRDGDGNLAASDVQNFKTPIDTRPPKVSDIVIETSLRGNGASARGQIIVSWKTDEPATSQVAYGQGSGGAFTNKSAEDAQLVTEHVVIVSDLPTSTVFHVKPVSKDGAGNEGEGIDQSAIVGRASESVLTIIFNTIQRIFGL